MQICQIRKDIFSLYQRFLPLEVSFDDLARRGEFLFGFYDQEGVHGAALVRVEEGTAEILSLIYEQAVQPGICEELLTSVLLQLKDQFNLYSISYIAEGEQEELDSYDYVMMDQGYYPRPGETRRYEATLQEIVDNLGVDTLKHSIKMLNKKDVIRVCDAPKGMIERFNQKHPENPYRFWEQDDKLSILYRKDDDPKLCIYCNINEEGSLVFNWMEYDREVRSLIRLGVAMILIVNAIQLYPMDTKVVICPFMSEVELLIARFGFRSPEDYQPLTHIYSYYIDERRE